MCKEISFDVLEFEIGFMEFVVAVVAEPKQTVFESFAYANAFDDQPDGSCRSSWAMGYTRGEKEHVARAQVHIHTFSILLGFNGDFTFELIKQLFGFVVVIIFACVGSTHDHHNIIGAFGV